MTDPRSVEPPKEAPSDTDGGHLWMRRTFLARAGWTALFGTMAASSVAFVRLLFPRAPIVAPTQFAIGRPTEYRPGSVTSRDPPDGAGRSVWIVRNEAGFYALLGRCTHLGCTPRWQAAAQSFKCPCHGSVFTREGGTVSGPAPRALERVHIELTQGGILVVDPARRYRQEKGEWDQPGASVEWSEAGHEVG